MPDFESIEARDRRPCFMLRISGVPVTFGTVNPKTFTYIHVASDVGLKEYKKSSSIIPGRGFNFEREMRPDEGIVESAPVSVFLAVNQHNDGDDESDPGHVFGRLGYESADFSAQLIEQIDHENNPTLKLTTVGGLSTGDFIHIGREAMEVGVVNTLQKTVTITQRGALGTTKVRHRVSAVEGVFPLVTKPAVFFRGRRAVIYEGALDKDGNPPGASDWIERYRGFVAKEPEFSTDGRLNVVRVEVSPLTAALDRPVESSAGDVRLHTRLHTFDGEVASDLKFYESVEQGEYLCLNVTQTHGNGMFSADTSRLRNVLPIDANGAPTLNPLRHIRRVPLIYPFGFSFSFFLIDQADFVNNQVLLKFVDPATGNVSDAAQDLNTPGTLPKVLENRAFGEVIWYRFGQHLALLNNRKATVLWPDVLEDKQEFLSFDGGLRTHLGSDSLEFSRFQYVFNLAAGVITVTPNFGFRSNVNRFGDVVSPTAKTVLTSDPLTTVEVSDARDNQVAFNLPTRIFYNRLSFDVDEQATFLETPFSNVGNSHIPSDVIKFGDDPESNSATVEVTIDENTDRARYAVDVPVSIAKGFYTAGPKLAPIRDGVFDQSNQAERWITFENDPGVPQNSRLNVNVYAGDDDDRVACLEIGEAQERTVDGVTGFVCEVYKVEYFGDSLDRSIVDDGGILADRPRFVAGVQFDATTTIGEIALQLLTSSDGANVTSDEFDVLPFGAGLTHKELTTDFGLDIDADSFLAIPNVPGVSVAPRIKSGDTLFDVLRPLLQLAGYGIDMAVDDQGRCRLSAVPFGLPNESAIEKHFLDADISDTPTPSSPASLEIRNVFKFESNFDDKDDAQLKKNVRDTVSINTFGEAGSLSISLPGVQLPTDPAGLTQVLRPVFSRLRTEMAYPRRLFRFGVRSGMAARLKVGATYKVSSSFLRGLTGVGVSNALCRLRRVQSDGFDPIARVEFIFFGFHGAGWAPSLEVTVKGGASLTVSESAFTPSADFEDLDGFTDLQPGDSVVVISGADTSVFSTRTIVSINTATNIIVLDSDPFPGIALPSSPRAFIVPAVYASAPAAHQPYTFIQRTRLS